MSPEDKSRANLFILSDEGQDKDTYSFKSVTEAKDFMEGLRNDNTPYRDLVCVYETYVGNLDYAPAD